jgi:hypothetical protein
MWQTKSIVLGIFVGVVLALCAAIWFALSYLARFDAAAARMEGNAEAARITLAEAVAYLESIGRPDRGVTLDLGAPIRRLR